ncbi:MAG: acyl carrier protein [Steroidobacteraceae bacterium]
MQVAERTRQYILENFLFSNDPSQLGYDDSFLERGLIDSTGMLEVIMFLEETFGVKVDDEEMVPANLDSVSKIAALVQRKTS